MKPKHKNRHAPRAPQRGEAPRRAAIKNAPPTGGGYWIYGWHAVQAALANPERSVRRILASEQNAGKIERPRKLPEVELTHGRDLDHLLGADAVHQGIAALVAPLEQLVLEDVLHRQSGTLLILDQVSDPHNVGAIFRSAAAFGVAGIIAPKDHSAPETAVLAKSACGGVDIVPRITVTNLASAIRELKEHNWWVIGLDGEAKTELPQLKPGSKTVLVLGAEGKGMRRLTAELCDETVRLPMDARMESLNVSNAAAIALYHLYAGRHG